MGRGLLITDIKFCFCKNNKRMIIITDGPLRAALLKTMVRCEDFETDRSSSFFLLQELRPFVGPKTNPDTDTGTCPIPPVTVFRVKAYSWGVLREQ